MFAMEISTQTVATLYHVHKGFPFSSYGENVSLGIGNYAILLAFLFFGPSTSSSSSSSLPSSAGSPVSATTATAILSFIQRLPLPLGVKTASLELLLRLSRVLRACLRVTSSHRVRALAALSIPFLALPLLAHGDALAFLQVCRIITLHTIYTYYDCNNRRMDEYVTVY